MADDLSLEKRIRFRAVDAARHALDAALDLDADELGRIFTRLDAAKIMAAADASDACRAQGETLPLHGMTISIKDLYDEAGEVTGAGSAYLQSRAPAETDAPAVARLVAAGAVPFGRTNMTEFAYSGIGLNPHFGTPGNAADPDRIPGGSSSGSGVAVALGIGMASLGSDTGGSIRIPSALNGVTGFKPSQNAVPTEGAFPLSPSMDSVGPLARDIATCARIHAVLSVTSGALAPEAGLSGVRVGLVTTRMLDGLDDSVAMDFDRARTAIESAGAALSEPDAGFLELAAEANRLTVWAEAHEVHSAYLDQLDGGSDAHVLKRLRSGLEIDPADVAAARATRHDVKAAWAALFENVDVLIAPTVPTVAPTIAEADADFDRLNALMLRNTQLGNFCDCCAATLPMQDRDVLPTGLMVMGANGADWHVLDIASRIERVLTDIRA
ncbi:MAG: amidase family protein [Pseudomonadota bacterium]